MTDALPAVDGPIESSANKNIGFRVEKPGKIWELIKGGAQNLESHSAGFVKAGPSMGNIGKAPRASHHIHINDENTDDLAKTQGGNGQIIPSQAQAGNPHHQPGQGRGQKTDQAGNL